MKLLRIILSTFFLTSLSACMQLNTAGVVDNIGRKYEAVLVEKGTISKPREEWDACEADGKFYIKVSQAIVREQIVWVEDAAFSQLPHKTFYFDEKLGGTCYYQDGKICQSRPEHATDTTTEAKSLYPFYTVYSSKEIKHPQRYEPIRLKEQPNPHRIYTAPLSWIASVVVDIPGSIIFTALALPGEIYSAIFD